MPEPKKRKSVHVPPEVYEQLWATAHLAGVPVQEVIRIALVHFARLDHSSKIGVLGEFWYRGQYAPEPRGQRQVLLPPDNVRHLWDEQAGAWRDEVWCRTHRAWYAPPKKCVDCQAGKPGVRLMGVVRARLTRWQRWLAGTRGTKNGAAA